LDGEVRAAKYVGGKGEHVQSGPEHLQDKRAEIRANPPDILLTNYRMLDLLLMRPRDRDLWRHNGPETLRYLVLDELHTYDGAQGSDVACLIRRLRARLGRPAGGEGEGRICCVGTSATIGGGSEESKDELPEFAEKVFGTPFGSDSVVDEARRSIDHVLADERTDAFPATDDPGVFDPSEYTDLEEFAAAQVEAWFGDRIDNDPLAVGRALRENHELKYLLQAADGGPWAWPEFRRRFAHMEPEFADLEEPLQDRVLHSLLTLVSWARRWSEESDEEEPFLRVRVQSWVKELRRLIRKFDDEPCFEWEDQADDEEALWLPMVYCRECGESGFATKLPEGTTRVSDNPRDIGRAYFDQSRYARFVRLGKTATGEFQQYLCTECRHVGMSEECDRCDGRALAVDIWNGSGGE
ncbi:MAG: DEAD/DEAH box helicase, partial [Bradymonadaceae bacterium]